MGKFLPTEKFPPHTPSPTEKQGKHCDSPLPLSKDWHTKVTAHGNGHRTLGEVLLKSIGPTAVF